MFGIVVKTKSGKKIKNLLCPVNECGIGKARDNLLLLRGPEISPYHAEIQYTDNGLFIEDKSGGDTQVNGKDILRYGPLRPDDEISIGDFRISASMV